MALGNYGMASCYQCAMRGQSYCSCLNATQAAQSQLVGAIGGANVYMSLGTGFQLSGLSISGPAIAPAKSVVRKRCIEKLREEIKDWHGSVLKS